MIKAIIPTNESQIKQFISNQYQPMIHAKQVTSLSNAVLGAITRQSFIPSQIGLGMGQARGLYQRHAIKQVDRLLSNTKLDIHYCQVQLAKFLISNRSRITVAIDWTVFAKDNHLTLTLRLITNHGRSTPLLWKTVNAIGLKGNKNKHVFYLLEKLSRIVPADCHVIVLGDREFGTINNMKHLKEKLKFDYILRIKRNFTITNKQEIKKLAYEWLNKNKPTCIDEPRITVQEYPVKKVIIAHESGMKDLWVIACSLDTISTRTILNYYGQRWSIETSFRDEKDRRFGMGLKFARIKNERRRDCLLLISAIVIILLTLLGAACELAGYDKYLKANTVTRRTHSLFTQGRILIECLNRLKEPWRKSILEQLGMLTMQVKSITSEQFFI